MEIKWIKTLTFVFKLIHISAYAIRVRGPQLKRRVSWGIMIDVLGHDFWQPLSVFGYDAPWLYINKHTIIATWIVLGVLAVFLFPIRFIVRNKNSVGSYLVTRFVDTFMEMQEQALGVFAFGPLAFVIALFVFIFACNCASLIPFVEEPTQDLNTTLALGIIAFMYIQFHTIKAHGIKEYIKEYFSPFFLMFPLHVIGKLANIVSLSFRLYGNIFGGAIITKIYLNMVQSSWVWQTAGILTGSGLVITLFFSLFEGFLQAFVFSMLTITYLGIAVRNEGD